ncbi:MAG: hypothetical protein ACK5GO_03790 [Ignavibacteria bacterium]|jgi:hypothetical protein
MKNVLFISLCLVFFQISALNADPYFMCFLNDKNPNNGFSVYFPEEGRASHLLYKGKTEYIPLKFIKTKESKGRAYTDVYYEYFNGSHNGTYEFEFDGNWVYVYYTRKKDGKKFTYTIDHELTNYDYPWRSTPCF